MKVMNNVRSNSVEEVGGTGACLIACWGILLRHSWIRHRSSQCKHTCCKIISIQQLEKKGEKKL